MQIKIASHKRYLFVYCSVPLTLWNEVGLLKGNINGFFNINNIVSCQTFLYEKVATETDRQFWEIVHSSYLLYYARITCRWFVKLSLIKWKRDQGIPWSLSKLQSRVSERCLSFFNPKFSHPSQKTSFNSSLAKEMEILRALTAIDSQHFRSLRDFQANFGVYLDYPFFNTRCK